MFIPHSLCYPYQNPGLFTASVGQKLSEMIVVRGSKLVLNYDQSSCSSFPCKHIKKKASHVNFTSHKLQVKAQNFGQFR